MRVYFKPRKYCIFPFKAEELIFIWGRNLERSVHFSLALDFGGSKVREESQ